MNYAAARANMVESQLRPNKISDAALLAAMAAVPREQFVPDTYQSLAYIDEDLPLGGGRALMEPMVFGRLLQEAAIEAGDCVLDLGSGSGYSTAILARLAGRVIGVEGVASLAAAARRNLAELGIGNVTIEEGPLERGAPKFAPFEVIVMEGAVELVPDGILAQLAEGGRMVGVVLAGGIGRATLTRRIGGALSSRVIFDAAVARLPGFAREQGFVF